MFVRNKMTENPYTISPDQTIPDAHEIMAAHGVKRLPVMREGLLVGVVSREDIAHASPSKATSLSANEITYLLAKTKISRVMNKKPVVISPDALLEEAATLMRDSGVGFLPVVEGERLVGVITESDIFDAFIELLGFRDKGTRLTVRVPDAPGIMSGLTRIFAMFGVNITHVAVYRGTDGTSTIVIGFPTLATDEIEQAVAKEGYQILYKLQNR